MSAMTCDVGDHGDLSTPCRPFWTFYCKQRSWAISTFGSPNVFHWVTQRFPLGHPRFSTGSPKSLRIRTAKNAECRRRKLPLRLLLRHNSKEKANCQAESDLQRQCPICSKVKKPPAKKTSRPKRKRNKSRRGGGTRTGSRW